MDTFEKIRALLAEQLDLDPAKITMESDIMNDFEADSLDIGDMVMTLEDEFGIEEPAYRGRCSKLCGQPPGKRLSFNLAEAPQHWLCIRQNQGGAFNMGSCGTQGK